MHSLKECRERGESSDGIFTSLPFFRGQEIGFAERQRKEALARPALERRRLQTRTLPRGPARCAYPISRYAKDDERRGEEDKGEWGERWDWTAGWKNQNWKCNSVLRCRKFKGPRLGAQLRGRAAVDSQRALEPRKYHVSVTFRTSPRARDD